jgi:hypothetical protein
MTRAIELGSQKHFAGDLHILFLHNESDEPTSVVLRNTKPYHYLIVLF